GRAEVYVQPMTGGGAAIPVSTEGGVAPHWGADDRTLYYATSGTIIAATRAPGAGFSVASRKTVLDGIVLNAGASYVNWDLHPNGKEFLFIGFPSGADHLAWILNWPELIKTMANTTTR